MDNDKKILPPAVHMPQPMVEHTLEPGFELRIHNIKDHIKLLLLNGRAEVFGKELPEGEPVFFNATQKIAVFCWKLSNIQISGEHEAYTSDQTPMHIYVNIQHALNTLREAALKNKQLGPNILITGAQQSGKSTLCRILVNYALKLGWTPIFVDLDLHSDELSTPATISASVVRNPLPCSHADGTISFFHSADHIVTHELFNKQIEVLAGSVHRKLSNDLEQFKQSLQVENEEEIAPVNPEVYASGLIINGFTPNPSKKRETESLCQAIKQFKVSVVIVIDYEKLEKDIVLGVKDSNLKIIKVPKSPGIQSHLHSSIEEQQSQMYQAYQDYFRGKYHDLYLKSSQCRQAIQMPNHLRQELEPHPVSLPLHKLRIFEVKGHEIPLSALPSGSTQSEWTTILEEVRDLEKNFTQHRHKLLANLMPTELKELRALEQRISQNPANTQLREDFKDALLASCCVEFIQIKDLKSDPVTQKKLLEVVRICMHKSGEDTSGEEIDFDSNYFLLSDFSLKRNVF